MHHSGRGWALAAAAVVARAGGQRAAAGDAAQRGGAAERASLCLRLLLLPLELLLLGRLPLRRCLLGRSGGRAGCGGVGRGMHRCSWPAQRLLVVRRGCCWLRRRAGGWVQPMRRHCCWGCLPLWGRRHGRAGAGGGGRPAVRRPGVHIVRRRRRLVLLRMHARAAVRGGWRYGG